MPGAVTRAGRAGYNMADAIIESVHLMYQNNTALAYLREMILTLQLEKDKRERIALDKTDG